MPDAVSSWESAAALRWTTRLPWLGGLPRRASFCQPEARAASSGHAASLPREGDRPDSVLLFVSATASHAPDGRRRPVELRKSPVRLSGWLYSSPRSISARLRPGTRPASSRPLSRVILGRGCLLRQPGSRTRRCQQLISQTRSRVTLAGAPKWSTLEGEQPLRLILPYDRSLTLTTYGC